MTTTEQIVDGITPIVTTPTDIEQLIEQAEAAGVDTKKTLSKATKRITAKEKRERESRQYWSRSRVEDAPFWQREFCPTWCCTKIHDQRQIESGREHRGLVNRVGFSYDARVLSEDNIEQIAGCTYTELREPGISLQVVMPSGAAEARIRVETYEGDRRVTGSLSPWMGMRLLRELGEAINLCYRPRATTQAEALVSVGITPTDQAPEGARTDCWTGLNCAVTWCHSDHQGDNTFPRAHHGRFGTKGVQLSMVETAAGSYDEPTVFCPPFDDALTQREALGLASSLAAAASVYGIGQFRGDLTAAERMGIPT